MTSICIILTSSTQKPLLVTTFMLDTKTPEEKHSALTWWEQHATQTIPTALQYLQESVKKAMDYVSETIEKGTGHETKYVLSDATCQCKFYAM